MTISEADRKVIEQLAKHGDNPAVPRAVMHFFYGQLDQLSELNQRLVFPNWKESELSRGRDDYRLLATKVTDLTEDSVELMMKEVEGALAGLVLEYDGWEASVERSS